MGFRELQRAAGQTHNELGQLRMEHAQTRGMLKLVLDVLNRNLRGRLRWLLFGK